MATASDFAIIIGDNEAEVSARTTSGGRGDEHFNLRFTLDNPRPGGVLMFMVRALSNADYEEPRIIINGITIGHVQRSVGAEPNTWYTQIVRIDDRALQDGDNDVAIFAATAPIAGERPDSFFLRAMVCHYRKTV
jgi:hypothetical protein